MRLQPNAPQPREAARSLQKAPDAQATRTAQGAPSQSAQGAIATSPTGDGAVAANRAPLLSLDGATPRPMAPVELLQSPVGSQSGTVTWSPSDVDVPERPATDADPMHHIEILASEEMQGRDSPSEGLDKAANYIRDFMQSYGLQGVNPGDPQGEFFQTFDYYGFKNEAPRGAHAHDEHAQEFGGELFEHGFYLDDNLKPEDIKVIADRYAEGISRGDIVDPVRSPRSIESVEDLQEIAQAQGTVQNVMGKIEGTGPNKDEVIVVMAHYDHVGVNWRGEVNHGADDNASGTATAMSMIPELMEKAKNGELDRSVVFLFTAAEEKGLLGAKYFIDHPIPGVTLDEIEGVINIDMIGRWDDERFSIIDETDGEQNHLGDAVAEANAEMDDPFDRINEDINHYHDRQDGWLFSKEGEDVLFAFEGLSNPKGGGSINPDYHRPTDTIDKIYEDNGGEKVRRLRDLFTEVLLKVTNPEPTEAPAPAEQLSWD